MSDPETINMLVDRVSVIKCHECHSEVDVSRAHSFSVVRCPECGADLPVPALLGNFVLFKTIGKGAMGAVYQGFDQTLKRHVAIKVILQQLGDDQSFVDNFIREAQALAALNHINVVQIYSCGTEKGQPYIVMEMINGSRLDELMSDGPMKEQRVLEIALEVANGLSAAHDIGLIHGDIKPQNILLDGKGTAKVVDFGLARSADDEAETAEIWGTPYYIAPEKARRQKEDHRADIYCLGATLFHALAGRPPFEGETAKDVVVKRLQEAAPNLQDLRPELNDETAQLIARMLEADPFRRYPTYNSMHADLNKALEASKQGPRSTAVSSPKGKSPALAISLVVGMVLVCLGAWFGIQKNSSKAADEDVKGRTVMKVVNGKLVPVFIPFDAEDASAGAAAGEGPTAGSAGAIKGGALAGYTPVAITTKEGKGADSYIDSTSQKKNFGQAATLQLNHIPSPAGKIYMRFDCSSLNLFKCKLPSVQFTLADEFVVKAKNKPVVQLWGVRDVRGSKPWVEGTGGLHAGFTGPLTWNNAPGNAIDSQNKLLKEQAELLATYTVKESLQAGDTIKFALKDPEAKNPILDFIQDDKDKVVTFVLTMVEAEQGGAMVVASREHLTLAPPTLELYLGK